MTIPLLSILSGLLLLLAGGELLLRGAVGLAILARLTPAVIGLTVVAAGTSVPELAVSMAAITRGSSDVAVGNVVGSNIFNIAFILGLAALIRPLAITGNTLRLEYPVLLVVTLMCLVVCSDGGVSRPEAILFVTTYVAFTAYLVVLVRKQLSIETRGGLIAEVKVLNPDSSGPRPAPLLCISMVAAGVALLALGANLTVSGAIEVGRAIGLSQRVIGLTIVAGGTGLPEVVTSLVSSVRGRDDVAIGNVIGSNLFNILGTLGLSALFRPLAVSPALIAWDNWWMLGVTVLLLPLIFHQKRINRWEGGLLLAVYLIYLGLVLSQPGGPE